MIEVSLESVSGMGPDRLEELVTALGEPVYRARQLRAQVFRALAFSYEEMTDLPTPLRERLAGEMRLHGLEPARLQEGGDGTIKALFTLADGCSVEAAVMFYGNEGRGRRVSLCVSTQVGCAVGCPFCATGGQGFERNLTAGEIVDQALYFARYLREASGERLSNIVFMGMGEPLANYDALMRAIRLLNDPEGFGLGVRNMTVSTAGLVPQINRFAREGLQAGLAVSLHAANNRLRDRLVPVNRRYPLEMLLAACREYFRATGRRVSFEYAIFRDVNDSPAQAWELAARLRGINCHVNLIPANRSPDPAFQPPLSRVVMAFERELRRLGINATVRQPRGQDIDAGCGQLRSRFKQDGGSGPR